MNSFHHLSDEYLDDLLGPGFDRFVETDSWCPIHQCKKHQRIIGENRVQRICYECYKLEIRKMGDPNPMEVLTWD